jgi:L-threonylcarbamoyladenylate synthase
MVLRPGGTPFEALSRAIGEVKLHPFVVAEAELPLGTARSPGMRHRHYAPNAKVILVEGSVADVTAKVRELIASHKREACKVGVLATDETITQYEADVVKSLGSRFNLAVIAQNLFRLLREFDADGVDIVIAEGVPAEGLGLAVMNRLRKASAYNIIKA